MKTLISIAAVAAALLSPLAQAADMATDNASKPMRQQSKMKECNQKAGDAKGDERKSMMKECLTTKKVSQQSRMKTCNVDAKGKTGDERKSFMKECLSNKA